LKRIVKIAVHCASEIVSFAIPLQRKDFGKTTVHG
jgi:hypothetical protein